MTDAVATAIVETTAADTTPKSGVVGKVIFWGALGYLALLTGAALVSPWLPFLEDPDQLGVGRPTQGLSGEFWFGTDELGRDVFSRTIDGARVSLFIGLVGTAIGMFVGGLLGLVAGFYRGWVDNLISGIVTIMLSVPSLVLVTFIVSVKGQELKWVVIALCLLAIPALARIVRGTALQFTEREFVYAAQVLGARKPRVMLREVLPNVVPTMVSFGFLSLGILIAAEGALAFLGLGVDVDQHITWGNIIATGRSKLAEAPHIVLAPSILLFLTVLSLNFVGDQLIRRFDIRESLLK